MRTGDSNGGGDSGNGSGFSGGGGGSSGGGGNGGGGGSYISSNRRWNSAIIRSRDFIYVLPDAHVVTKNNARAISIDGLRRQ